MKLITNQWNWWHVLLMEQLYVRWIRRHWVLQCPPKCQELRKLYAVVWRAPVTGDVNISTTYQLSQIRVNSTITDRPISTSRQTANITMSQVCSFIKYVLITSSGRSRVEGFISQLTRCDVLLIFRVGFFAVSFSEASLFQGEIATVAMMCKYCAWSNYNIYLVTSIYLVTDAYGLLRNQVHLYPLHVFLDPPPVAGCIGYIIHF